MTAKTMAEVIRAHQPTTGMSVASCVTCRCGYWNGEERAGINRPVGYQGLQWHQAQELSAAGFGLVTDAKAEALEEAADKIDRRAKNVRNNTHIESPNYQSFVEHAENRERNARWLRLRADSERSTK